MTCGVRAGGKSQGGADRHIGCPQRDRPSTGGGGKGWPAALTKRDRLICSAGQRPGNTPEEFCRSGSRLGEFEETSERLTPTNVAAALNGLGGHSHVRDGVPARWRRSDG